MKICMLTDAWLPVWGGGQEHVKQVAKILKEKYEYQVDIIAPTLINPKFKFSNFFHRVWFAFWVLRFLFTSDYDIYHSHNFSTSAFLPIVKLRDKKTAVTVHGLGKKMVGGGLLDSLGIGRLWLWLVLRVWPFDYRFSAGNLDGYLTVSNGINIKEFDAVKAKKDPAKFRIFWIGRKYDPVKGVRFLEEAVKKIDNPKVELDLADGIYGREKIQRFKQADLFVLPSLSEGLPIVLLEAMASKLPIVATDVGDCKKLIETAKCGLIVAPGNAVQLADAIRVIIKDKKNYGENGYEFVKKNYSWDKVAAVYYSSYSHAYSKLQPQ
ncbi:glycosyltransferase family 4 protein [Patescibacteria group bacterium]|nr:glycosyltransferase family 4 protein [Patescibacteria group bacterium]